MGNRDFFSYDTIVIGGSQSGLAAGYYLKRAGRSFLIIDANRRPGDTWRRRWDSLRLFSPAQYDGLPGLPLPAPKGAFPTKDQMADYLDLYANHFELPMLHECRVKRVSLRHGVMAVECGELCLRSANVIVATGAYARPARPEFAGQVRPDVQQLHSSEYRRPSDVHGNTVLVAGFGTSGVEIAIELAQSGRKVILAGHPTSEVLTKFVPRMFSATKGWRLLAGRIYWQFIHRVLTVRTPIGRKAKEQSAHRGKPLLRFNRADAIAAGVECVPRVAAVEHGLPRLEDGGQLDVSAVVWCTGSRPDHDFLDFPELAMDAHGFPEAKFGAAANVPGLYFVGMPFQVGLTSTLIGGAGRDAALVVRQIGRDARRGIEQRGAIEELQVFTSKTF